MDGFTAFFISVLVVSVCWLSQLAFTLKRKPLWILCWSTGSEDKKGKRSKNKSAEKPGSKLSNQGKKKRLILIGVL